MDKPLYYRVFWPESQEWMEQEKLVSEGLVIPCVSNDDEATLEVFVEKETYKARHTGI